MQVLKGYYNGKEIIPLEKVEIKPNQKVTITLLDEYYSSDDNQDKPYKKYVGKLTDESLIEISEALKETERIDVKIHILKELII